LSTLADALVTLRECEWVDLTHAFAPGIPHYAGFADEERRVLGDFEAGAEFVVHEYKLVGQWGTHVDPPSHFGGAQTLDAISVTGMLLPLTVVHAGAPDPDFVCTQATLTDWEAEHGRIPEGAFVALHTGWGAHWPDAEALRNDGHSPGWGVDAVEWLARERAVTAIGHDTLDTDPGALIHAGQAPAEAAILKAGRWQLELLANLDRVPATGALICATWPKPQGGSGFPARAFAIVPRTSTLSA
jgi:kynurenine formamidase